MKKLKVVATKMSGPRPGTSATPSRSDSAANSASSSESSDSDSEDESQYSDESEIEVRPEEPSPLPSIRPADPNKAVEYDIIKTVWAKRSKALSGTVIRTALGEYWDIFKSIRDKWKAKSTSLQQAIEKKDQANKTAYERRVVEQRRLVESCIRLTLKHGHPSIVEKYVYLRNFPSIIVSRIFQNPCFLEGRLVFVGRRFGEGGKYIIWAALGPWYQFWRRRGLIHRRNKSCIPSLVVRPSRKLDYELVLAGNSSATSSVT